MTTDEYTEFYLSLSPIEQVYWQRFFELFQLVQPQKPEKGIKTLILRAQAAAMQAPLETTLQSLLEGATERTHNRLKLLQHCSLSDSSQA